MAKRNRKLSTDCPFEAAMDLIAGKWKGMILFRLMKQKMRFNELKTSINGISQKMLSQQLKELEKSGIIDRKIYPQIPPKVEYSLTPLGRGLEKSLKQIRDWGKLFIT